MTPRFVDSNIFVYVLMNDPRYATNSLHILTRFEDGLEAGWTSTLALSHVFAHLRRRKRHKEIDKFYEYLEGTPVSVTETTRTDLEQARNLKSELNLPWSLWDDLVLASQMQRMKIDEIYSNDTDFDRITGVKRVF